MIKPGDILLYTGAGLIAWLLFRGARSQGKIWEEKQQKREEKKKNKRFVFANNNNKQNSIKGGKFFVKEKKYTQKIYFNFIFRLF